MNISIPQKIARTKRLKRLSFNLTSTIFRHVKESSEYVSLQCLKRKLRQFIHVLQLLGTHEWGNGIAEIQDASGFYMLQSTLPHKTLLQANREIGLHLQFITQLASNVGFLKQLEGILYYHSQNVENLLKRVKEESTDTF